MFENGYMTRLYELKGEKMGEVQADRKSGKRWKIGKVKKAKNRKNENFRRHPMF